MHRKQIKISSRFIFDTLRINFIDALNLNLGQDDDDDDSIRIT